MGGRGAKSKVVRKQRRINGKIKGGWPKRDFWSNRSRLQASREGKGRR